jgi:hypothetical protein
MPFFTEGHEGFDVNYLEDWREAEEIVETGVAKLPPVLQTQYSVGE